MMKKLLVLTLVLGIASLANAALITTSLTSGLDAVVDDVAKTISFVSTAAAGGDALSVTGLAVNMQLNATGTMGYVSSAITPLGEGFGPWLGDDWVGYSVTDTTGLAGTIATFSYTGAATKATLYNDDTFGNAEVAFRDSPTTNLGDMAIDLIIPEPATMTLLGLGALALRRKK